MITDAPITESIGSLSSYPKAKESGFFFREFQDPCYQLTFSHVDDFDCQHPNDFEELSNRITAMEVLAKEDDTVFELRAAEDTVISGHRIQIIAYKTEFQWNEHKYPITLISGVSEIEGRQIRVDCACAGDRCERFVTTMKRSIHSIKLPNLKYDLLQTS